MLSHNKDSLNWFYIHFESVYKLRYPQTLLSAFIVFTSYNFIKFRLWNIKCNLRNTPDSAFLQAFSLFFCQLLSITRREQKVFCEIHTRAAYFFINTFEISSWREYFVTLCFLIFFDLASSVHRRLFKCLLFNRNKLEFFSQYLRVLSFYDDFYEEASRYAAMKWTWNFHDHLTVSKGETLIQLYV